MSLFNINSRYALTVRREIDRLDFVGPWLIMPEVPGEPAEQLWVHEVSDAALLRLVLPFEAIKPVPMLH
jgi:hypothetical protein